jgi:hypothetical protein
VPTIVDQYSYIVGMTEKGSYTGDFYSVDLSKANFSALKKDPNLKIVSPSEVKDQEIADYDAAITGFRRDKLIVEWLRNHPDGVSKVSI